MFPLPHEPIVVTLKEYWTIGFILYNIAMMYTACQIFKAPHEREDDEKF